MPYREPDTPRALRETTEQYGTTWNEHRYAGKELLESTSTTHPPNSRILIIRDGKFLNEDERDEFFTHNPPLYEATVQPGEEVIIQGKERNAYMPGSDFVTRTATEVLDTGPEGQYLPDGVTIETGYADLTGAAGHGPATLDNGLVFRITSDDVLALNYRSGTESVTKSVEAGEWITNPFEKYDFDFSRFSIKGIEGNLYGAGAARFYIKLRDNKGEEHYEKVASLGEVADPITDRYNLFSMSAKVTVEETAAPFRINIGPLNYFNEISSPPPHRRKEAVYRNLPVSASLGSNNFTTLKIFRPDPAHRQAALELETIIAKSDNSDGRIEVREIHPDFINWGTFDPDVESNWKYPPGQRPDETNLQEADIAPGVASIALDADNKLRGVQRGVGEFDGGRGNARGVEKPVDVSERISEFDYMVVGGKLNDTSQQITRLQVYTKQRW